MQIALCLRLFLRHRPYLLTHNSAFYLYRVVISIAQAKISAFPALMRMRHFLGPY